jgi:polyphenol oxidase
MAWVFAEVGRARVVFADRTGGVSRPPFHWANTGNDVGDDRAAVWENRRRVGEALGGPAADPSRWARVKVEHGATVVIVSSSDTSRAIGDVAITSDPEAALSFRSADCGPLVLAAGDHVALVHIGWRGLAAGVVSNALEAMQLREPGRPIEAMLGPTIGACCYSLPEAAIAQIDHATGVAVGRQEREDGTRAVDLVHGISSILRRCGVALRTIDVCTSCSDEHFSYRRDGAYAGRQAIVVRLDN